METRRFLSNRFTEIKSLKQNSSVNKMIRSVIIFFTQMPIAVLLSHTSDNVPPVCRGVDSIHDHC